jgi:hypothetical protein
MELSKLVDQRHTIRRCILCGCGVDNRVVPSSFPFQSLAIAVANKANLARDHDPPREFHSSVPASTKRVLKPEFALISECWGFYLPCPSVASPYDFWPCQGHTKKTPQIHISALDAAACKYKVLFTLASCFTGFSGLTAARPLYSKDLTLKDRWLRLLRPVICAVLDFLLPPVTRRWNNISAWAKVLKPRLHRITLQSSAH